MNKKVIVFVLALIVGVAVLSSGGDTAIAQTEEPLAFPVDQIVVKYKESANLNQAAQAQASAQMQRLNDAAGVAIEYFRPMSGDAHVLRLAKPLSVDDVLSVTARLAALPEVEFSEPDYRVFALEAPYEVPFAIPNDTRYDEQWHYFVPSAGAYGVNAPAAWDTTKGASGLYVAVIDTGITDHADLAGRWIGGYDFVTDSRIANDGGGRDSDPHDPGDWITSAESSSGFFEGCPVTDSSWHGTHVAGTIGAATNNGLGVAGLNWVSQVVPVRALGKCGGYTTDIADGIRWAAGLPVPGVPNNPLPAKVINLSLGGYAPNGCPSVTQEAVNAAYSAGSVVVVAAGNSNDNAVDYSPASCNNVITVASTDRNGNRAYYSNYGSVVEISAPGGAQGFPNDPNGVLSTSNTGAQGPEADAYEFYQGTSMAAPHVAGVASLMYSLNSSLAPSQVLTLMQNSVTPFPGGSTCNLSICGSGIVNAAAVLDAVPGAVPGTPTLSAISNPDGDGSFTVNWNDVNTATSYTLQEANNASFSPATTIPNILVSQYTATGKTGGTWHYRVRAVNNNGAGAWSNTVSVTVKPDAPVLDPISNPGNTDAYAIAWSASAGAEGYLLQEAMTVTFTSAATRYMGADQQYTVTGQAGGIWYYRVQAYNDAPVPGDWSNTEIVSVTVSMLGAPVLDPIINSDQESSFTVSWSDVLSATSYTLEESSNLYFVDPEVVYVGSMSQTYLENRDGGELYYRVRATTDTDQSPWSNSVSTMVRNLVFLPAVYRDLVTVIEPVLPTTFKSVADSCVLEGYPSNNYGDFEDMLAGYDDSFEPDGKIARSFARFDLSGIPIGTSISKATLYLYLYGSYDFPGETRTITIYRAGSPWSEMGVTWYSQPAIREAYGAAAVTHGKWGWYAFDVTGLVRGWVDGSWSNNGLAIRGPEHSGFDSSWKSFLTRESIYPPYIAVSYGAQVVRETQPMGASPVLTESSFMEMFSVQAEAGKQLLFENQSE